MDRSPVGQGGHHTLRFGSDRASTPCDETPHMTKRIIDIGLSAALLFAILVALGLASDRRATPLVRAVQRAKASVVNIHSVKTTYSNDSLFTASKGRKVNGMGTGIIVDERGYIATNNHVVQGVESLRVTLDDASIYDAKVVSTDQTHDLAIIKINAKRRLQVMPLGTSSDIMLGETVIAVGNAFGYEDTVTSGIVSALSRDVEVNETQSYQNLIQTDASINPGNSGGPLLNIDGEIVGINVAIRAGAQRIGFAIPIDDARKTIAKLLSIEQLDSTSHGLLSKDVKDAKRKMLVVESAKPDSPAAKAGFQPGDVIVKAGQVDVIDGVDFERGLLGHAVGESVDIEVHRNGKPLVLSLTLSALQPAEAVVRANNDETTLDKTWRILGMRLESLPPGERQSVGPQYRGGMRVVKIRSGSPAEINGIQQGDVLVGLHIWETVSLDNISYVLSHTQLRAFNPLKFYIIRGNETLYGHMHLASGRE